MDLAKPELLRHASSKRESVNEQTTADTYSAHRAVMRQLTDSFGSAAKQALINYSSAPLVPALQWNANDIRASHTLQTQPGSPDRRPSYTADPLNLSLVVEAGGEHVTILDNDKLELRGRIRLRSALTGSPQFTPDGRYAFLTTTDGWVSKVDITNQHTVAEVRAGLHTRNAAISGNGEYVAIANYQPQTLTVLDAELRLLRVLPVADKEGKRASRVLTIHTAAPRQSFVAMLKDVQEVWEISYNPLAPEIPMGVIHDFQYREGAFAPGFLNPSRTVLSQNVNDFAFSTDRNELIATAPGTGRQHIINLDVRRKIEEWTSIGDARLGASYYWRQGLQDIMAAPSETGTTLNLIDMQRGTKLAQIQLQGPVRLVRGHDGSRHLWTVSSIGQQSKETNTLTVIEKESLKVVTEFKYLAGEMLSHIGFSRDGRYMLAIVSGANGSVIAYNTQTLQEVKRIPIERPIGIYNTGNSISSTQGLSPFDPLPWCDHCTP